MRWLAWLLVGLQGRIGRKTWLIATTTVIAVMVGFSYGAVVLVPWLLDRSAEPDRFEAFALMLAVIGKTVFGFLILTALTVKRANDRNWPAWVGYLVFLPFLLIQLPQFLGYSPEPVFDRGWPVWAFGAYLLCALIVCLDCAIMKGTTGANRYGPDPTQLANRGAMQPATGS